MVSYVVYQVVEFTRDKVFFPMMRLITVKKYEKKNLHVIIIIIKFSLMHAFDPTSKPIYISTAYFATKYVVGSV